MKKSIVMLASVVMATSIMFANNVVAQATTAPGNSADKLINPGDSQTALKAGEIDKRRDARKRKDPKKTLGANGCPSTGHGCA